jgi:hypothetical protein
MKENKAEGARSKSTGQLDIKTLKSPRSFSAPRAQNRSNAHLGIKSSFSYSSIMKWSFKNNKNAEDYRRSMLPFYLLKDDSGSKHPRYIEQSTLS